MKGPKDFFDLDDFSNHRSSNYMSSTVFSIKIDNILTSHNSKYL